MITNKIYSDIIDAMRLWKYFFLSLIKISSWIYHRFYFRTELLIEMRIVLQRWRCTTIELITFLSKLGIIPVALLFRTLLKSMAEIKSIPHNKILTLIRLWSLWMFNISLYMFAIIPTIHMRFTLFNRYVSFILLFALYTCVTWRRITYDYLCYIYKWIGLIWRKARKRRHVTSNFTYHFSSREAQNVVGGRWGWQ